MDENTPIIGGPTVALDLLLRRLSGNAPAVAVDRRAQIAAAYTTIGSLAGVGNLIPFAQGVHETGWFSSWWFVEHNNPAGIGVTGRKQPGDPNTPPRDGVWQWYGRERQWRQGFHFDTVAAGVLAQIAHLLAYAGTDAQLAETQRWLLPFDVRLTAMGSARGKAPTWVGLNGKWAVPGKTYGQKILEIAERLQGSR